MKKRVLVQGETESQKERVKEISLIFDDYIAKMKENGSYYQYIEDTYNSNKSLGVIYENVIEEVDKNFNYIKNSLANSNETSLNLYLRLIHFAENNNEQWFELISSVIHDVKASDILSPDGLFFINNFWNNGVQDDWELYIVEENNTNKIVSNPVGYEKCEYLNIKSLENLLDKLSHVNKKIIRP